MYASTCSKRERKRKRGIVPLLIEDKDGFYSGQKWGNLLSLLNEKGWAKCVRFLTVKRFWFQVDPGTKEL